MMDPVPQASSQANQGSTAPRISVVFPVHRVDDRAGIGRAFASIAGQSFRDIEILLVANGSDADSLGVLRELAATDVRASVVTLPQANLAAAINEGLRRSRAELVARMDADDWSHPDRLAAQAAFMTAHPEVAAVGCSWERVFPGGERELVRVPGDPRELAWRLLLGNPLAHGSMMLRRSMVLAAGGYDPACTRAQDYDLWLRLARKHPIGAVPEVLYEYSMRHAGGREASVATQGSTAGASLARAWSSLPAGGDAVQRAVAAAIGPLLAGEHAADAAKTAVERVLVEHGPSVAALVGWLWIDGRNQSSGVTEVCRLARLQEVGGQMAAAGASRVWLWGAGRHTAWLVGRRDRLGLPIAGVVDDAGAGQQRHGFEVQPPAVLGAGDHVLISSDGFEEQIWASAGPARERGARVWRLYGENPGELPTDRKSGL